MYHGLINDIAIRRTDEHIRAILKYIDEIAAGTQKEYFANQSSNLFWKLPKIESDEVYKATFRALLSLFGIVEQTQTFYTLRSRLSETDETETNETT